VPGGFNTSIYFMLGGLAVAMGVVGTMIARGVRDTNSRNGRGFPLP